MKTIITLVLTLAAGNAAADMITTAQEYLDRCFIPATVMSPMYIQGASAEAQKALDIKLEGMSEEEINHLPMDINLCLGILQGVVVTHLDKAKHLNVSPGYCAPQTQIGELLLTVVRGLKVLEWEEEAALTLAFPTPILTALADKYPCKD